MKQLKTPHKKTHDAHKSEKKASGFTNAAADNGRAPAHKSEKKASGFKNAAADIGCAPAHKSEKKASGFTNAAADNGRAPAHKSEKKASGFTNAATDIKKNDVIEIEVDDLGMNGEGIAHYLGMTVFLRGALIGERVRAKIILVKKVFCVAIVEKILLPSVDRTTPACPVFGKCGGCTLQHLSYEAQLAFKRKRVSDTLKKVGGIAFEADCPVASEEVYAYRNKLSLPVRGTPPQIGFFAASSHRVVPVSACAIQFSRHQKLLALMQEFLDANGLCGYDETSGKGDIRHLVARQLGDSIVVTVVTPRASLPQITAFEAMLKQKIGFPYRLYLNINAEMSNVIWGSQTKFIGGKTGTETVDGLKIDVHPKSFFQVNDGVRRRLYAAVRAALFLESQTGQKSAAEPKPTVIEAYSGAGFLTAQLSGGAEKIIAIEREPTAVQSAAQLMRDNGICNVELIVGDAEIHVPKVAAEHAGKRLVALVDPPRAGCDKAVLDALVGARPQRLVYVSCNPSTLARDAALLKERGFVLTRVTPFDMFPQTAEVEVLTVFEPEVDTHKTNA